MVRKGGNGNRSCLPANDTAFKTTPCRANGRSPSLLLNGSLASLFEGPGWSMRRVFAVTCRRRLGGALTGVHNLLIYGFISTSVECTLTSACEVMNERRRQLPYFDTSPRGDPSPKLRHAASQIIF